MMDKGGHRVNERVVPSLRGGFTDPIDAGSPPHPLDAIDPRDLG